MKKLIALFAAFVLMLSVVACAKTTDPLSQATEVTNAPITEEKVEVKPETIEAETETEKEADDELTEGPDALGGFPRETITIVCPYSAGGGTDIGARNMAAVLAPKLGVNVVVENQTGAAGWIAWTDMINGGYTDGYRICLLNHNFVFGKLDETNPRDYTLDDIQLVCNQAIDYNVMAIRTNDTRFTDLESFITYSKENPVLIACQDPGILDGDASAGQWFNNNFNTNIKVVPVDGASDSRSMFISGDTDLLFGSISDVLNGYKNGEMKVICLFANERSDFMPDVPTIKEITGREFVAFSARGYFYPKGVPAEIVQFMTDTMLEVQQNPDYIENMTSMGLQVDTTAGEDFKELLSSQMETRLEIWGKK